MKRDSRVRKLCICAVCIALAFVLAQVRLYRMPQGGSLAACWMLFIALTGYWFGWAWGALAGVAYGLLDMLVDPVAVHPVQFLLDYPLACAALGLLPALVRRLRYGLYIGYILGVLGRLACVVASGAVFFAEYAPVGQLPVVYSFIYNASYILPEAVITLVIVSIPSVRRGIDRQRISLAEN